MESVEIKTELTSIRRVFSTLKPEKLLRQHTYVYIALLCLTALLIYYYSYPLEINSISIKPPNELKIPPESKSNGKTLFYREERGPDLDSSRKDQPSSNTIVSVSSTIVYRETIHDFSVVNIVSYNRTSYGDLTRNATHTNYSTSKFEAEISSDIPPTTTSELILHALNASENQHTKDNEESQAEETKASDILPNNTTKKNDNNDIKENNDLSIENSSASKQNDDQIKENEDRQRTTILQNKVDTTNKVEDPFNKLNITSKQNDRNQVNEAKDPSLQVSPMDNVSNSIVEATQVPNMTDQYLVSSKNCKIPDINPMHPSILEFVKFTDPLVCKDKDPLTITDGNMLFVDKAAAENRSLADDEFFCCYRPLYRDQEGSSDNKVTFGHCHDFTNKAKIRDEFIKVECAYKNETVFYEEFHSFIHDKTHVEERCKKYNDSKYSVLIIGLDSVSRMNMHRQLNKTSRYLLDNMDAIEMYGFNKVGDNTFPNLIPMLTGYDERELPLVCFNNSNKESLDKCNFLWKRYAEKGYRTLYAEDSPYISSFNYVKKGFFYQPTDYYIRPFMLAYEKALGHKKSLNCYTCLGSVSSTEAILHWAEQFASHFRDRPYFAFNWINSLTHDYMNLASSGDHFFEQFFRVLHQSGALNRTIVIVMGDHGMRWGPIRETYIGRLEERLPMLLIALPPDFKREFQKETEAMELNSHRLMTPFDLHATLVNLLYLKQNWTFSNPDKVSSELANNFTNRAMSLFQPVPQDRSCDDASIEEHWCTCESSLPMDTDDEHVEKSAKFLVEKLNNLLKPVRKMCATLTLKTISEARVWSPSSEHQGHSKDDNILTVIVQTSPGNAIFEGTVRISPPDENCELLGTVSRLNLYGNQSACVKNAVLRKYCYCL